MADAALEEGLTQGAGAAARPLVSRPSQILALTGADREAIQALLREAVERFSQAGYLVIGVVEEIEGGGERVSLRDLSSGARFALTQDLDPGSAGCSLDAAGLAAACGSVEAAISALPASVAAQQRTLVVLSKFGRQEAEGRGLTHAFHAAVAADLPILTSVSPVVSAAWAAFAGDLAAFASVEAAAIQAWQAAMEQASLAASN